MRLACGVSQCLRFVAKGYALGGANTNATCHVICLSDTGWHVRGRSAFADNDIDFAILGELIALATHHESTVAARGISPIAFPSFMDQLLVLQAQSTPLCGMAQNDHTLLKLGHLNGYLIVAEAHYPTSCMLMNHPTP